MIDLAIVHLDNNAVGGCQDRRFGSLPGGASVPSDRAGDAEILRWCRRVVGQVNALGPEMGSRTDEALRGLSCSFRERLSRGEPLDDLLPEAFAAVREAADRTLGQRPFDVQVMGGAVLHLGRHLNKGESMHALRRDVFYAHEGAIRRRHLQQQNDQAWCLTLAANAITAWTTEYLGLAVEQLRSHGRRVDAALLAHLSPAQSDNIGLIGTITVDIDHELAQLDPTGHRPLRAPATASTAP